MKQRFPHLIICFILSITISGCLAQGVPISQLPTITMSAAGALDSSGIIPVVQDSVAGQKKTYKATVQQLRSYFGGSFWGFNGNTVGPSHYIGTNNDADLIFKTDGLPAGFISSSSGSLSLGRITTTQYYAGGGGNVNTAVGVGVMTNNIGSQNTAMGNSSLSALVNGSYNVAYGWNSGYDNVDGSYNTSIGAFSSADSGQLDYTVSLGFLAKAYHSRELSLSPELRTFHLGGLPGNDGDVLTYRTISGRPYGVFEPSIKSEVIIDSAGYVSGTTPSYTHSLSGQPTIRSIEGKFGNEWRYLPLSLYVDEADNPNSKVIIESGPVSYPLILRITLIKP